MAPSKSALKTMAVKCVTAIGNSAKCTWFDPDHIERRITALLLVNEFLWRGGYSNNYHIVGERIANV